MITKRIIPCLDVRNGRVVKGTNFEGIKDVADPVEMARMYNAAGADELVFYDITASAEGRALFTDILTRVASEVFIPLTVGGGINTLEDFDRVLKCGADKVSVNSGALRNPDLIPAAARRYGNQCVVLSADVKRVNGQFRVFAKGGREDTGRDALDWIRWCVDHGAGEICLNSIDTDGVRNGFDLEMLDAVAARVDVPIIASGGKTDESIRRTIETELNSRVIRLHDVLTNFEAEDEPYMLLYHFNFGYPLLQADTLVEASKAERTPMNELSTDYHHMMAPVDGRGEELYFRTNLGSRACGVVYNERLELGAYVAFDTANLPNMVQWKMMKSHDYVLALEPCNTFGINRDEAAKEGKLAVLPAYASVENHLELGVLDGLTEIRSFLRQL